MNITFTLIAQALAFALFIWFTVKFVWPPLMRAIEQRQKQIADGLAAGERGREELEAAGKRAHEELAKARERVGEIIFLLLWMLAGVGIAGAFFAVLFGFAWAIFHILIVLLQAYIFMMLTIVYISMAHESH